MPASFPNLPNTTHVAMTRSGLDLLLQSHLSLLEDKRLAIVCHPATVNQNLLHILELLGSKPSIYLQAIFGPEHGFLGDAQDLIPVADLDRDGTRIHTLYGENLASLKPSQAQLQGVQLLIIDMQDVGSRYYTFQATMFYCLEAAQEQQIPVLILDRPNPINGVTIEGPSIQPGFESFVGIHPLPIRHGLTMGELACLYHAERRYDHPLSVMICENWQRSLYWDQTGLPWVLPSPNMPTLDTAIVYPGQCLFEGTNLSEGRGTTRPFELCGAPWLQSSSLVKSLQKYALSGVVFRPCSFRPTFHKFAGELCHGVQIHVTDRSLFQPVRTSLALLIEMRLQNVERFRWRTEKYEFVETIPAIDILFGSDLPRQQIEAGVSFGEITADWFKIETEFAERRKPYLLYSH